MKVVRENNYKSLSESNLRTTYYTVFTMHSYIT